jgi:hypothetical protein
MGKRVIVMIPQKACYYWDLWVSEKSVFLIYNRGKRKRANRLSLTRIPIKQPK